MYPFMDDESATLWNEPVLRDISSDIADLSRDQLAKVLTDMMAEDKESTPEEIEDALKNWSYEKLAQAMWDIHCLMFNSAAIVDPCHADMLFKVGEKLSERFGNDSSTYDACASFASILKAVAIKVIPFPAPNSDFYYTEMT